MMSLGRGERVGRGGRARRRTLLAGFGLGVVLFALTAWLAYRQNETATAAAAQVEHTLQVLQTALELDTEILQMETAHRGWLVRGTPPFLVARDRHRDAAAALVARLRAETADNAGQQARLARVEGLLRARHERMRATVAAAAEGGLDAARGRFQPDGTGSLGPLRREIAALRDSEQRLLAARTERAADGAARLRVALLVMPAVAMAVLFAAFRALLGALGRSEALRDELAETGAVQRAMFESSGYMIIAVDPEGTIRLFNRAASERLGWRAEELVGRESPAVFHDPDEVAARAAALSDELERPVSGFETFVARVREGGIDDREWTFVARDGERFPVQLAVSAVRDDAGELRGFIGVAQDISRRQAADREIRELNRALQASVRELEGFSYSVSHDLRAPLRHIDGYARMLVEDVGDTLAAEPRRFLDAISASSRRMGALIDDLLGLARLGRKPVTRQAVDMAALATEAWAEVTADGRHSAQLALAPLPEVDGDPSLLRQVWLNLLGNAVKYSARRGDEARIEVSASRSADSVAFHVLDNGVGFDMRYADKLFGVFQRLHAQDEFEGTGVGLAIVHRIVDRHGGTVWAESGPGLGACFSFELPTRDE